MKTEKICVAVLVTLAILIILAIAIQTFKAIEHLKELQIERNKMYEQLDTMNTLIDEIESRLTEAEKEEN